MITRRVFVGSLAGGLLAPPRAASAQQAPKVWRIGFLGPPLSSEWGGHLVQAFQQGLRERGYVEGQNITIEYRSTESASNEQIRVGAAELVRLRIEVLVVSVTLAALAAKEATRTIPIVMVNVTDPVASGLIASLARPGGNITGLTTIATEVVGKQMGLLKEAIPRASRVGILWNPLNPDGRTMLGEAEAAAKSIGLQGLVVEARGPDDFEGAFSAMVRGRVSAALVLADGMFYIYGARMAELTVRHRLPAMFGLVDQAKFGGLMAYGRNPRENYRRAAYYVDRILKGAKPANLPVEQPTKFELVINLKTAKALGLTIPPSLLARADEVIR
jgi:putative tryptophan/tyrosine transport system substrate-binding protein